MKLIMSAPASAPEAERANEPGRGTRLDEGTFARELARASAPPRQAEAPRAAPGRVRPPDAAFSGLKQQPMGLAPHPQAQHDEAMSPGPAAEPGIEPNASTLETTRRAAGPHAAAPQPSAPRRAHSDLPGARASTPPRRAPLEPDRAEQAPETGMAGQQSTPLSQNGALDPCCVLSMKDPSPGQARAAPQGTDRNTEAAAEPSREASASPGQPPLMVPLAAQAAAAPRVAPAPAVASSHSHQAPHVIGTATPGLKGTPQKTPTLLDVAADRPQTVAAHHHTVEGKAPSKKTEERESSRDDRAGAAVPLATLQAPKPEVALNQAAQGPVARAAESAAVAAPNPLPHVLPAHLEDPSLRVVVLPNIARMNVETQDGSLSLQVRVHDGVTDVRASGAGAMLVEARQGELRLALAHEGLKLGQFDLTQSDSGSSRHQRHEQPDDRTTAATPRPTLRQQPTTTLRADGRLSVKA